MNPKHPSQQPMFLRGVEDNPKPSVYGDLIENAKSSGGDYWQIWHLLAFDPEAAHHLAALSHTLMHNEAPITPGLRELIAAYTSSLNQCEFCMKAHGAVAAELLGDEALVWGVIRDPESSSPSTSPPRIEPLAILHSASVMPSRATSSSTSVVTRTTSSNRSGWHAA